jgi:hypothetical protein
MKSYVLSGLSFLRTGQSDSVTHVHIYRNPDTKIQEHWAVRDELSMLRPLGVLG